ncbi:MAG: hypothetical protein JO347_00645 [Candidatus Eremiobacteraeota bacterium]|nr:hypothetical protein [Candidatus Eremiobacteraeota bacterium]
MRKQILTQGSLRQAETSRFNRAEMHAYYIAIVSMPRLVLHRSDLERDF